MRKHKLSIYMKSGNIIYLRIWSYNFNIKQKSYSFTIETQQAYIDNNEIEAIIVKKWFQKWG